MGELDFPESKQLNWNPSKPIGDLRVEKVYLGNGENADRFQVIVANSNRQPSITDFRGLYADRVQKRSAKVAIAVVVGNQCFIFGPNADSQVFSMDLRVAKQFLSRVLAEPDLTSAYQRFSKTRRAVENADTPWFTNHGLFASYYIRESASKRRDWDTLTEESLPLLKKRGEDLINNLGFSGNRKEQGVQILSSSNDSSVVAILLTADENFEGKTHRFQSSPVTWALKVASDKNIKWVIAVKKGSIRLYPAKDGLGVGQRGQVETFFELDLDLLDESNAGFLSLVFSEKALKSGGLTEELLSQSARYSTSLGERLRDRIYLDVVPDLSKAVAKAVITGSDTPTLEQLSEAYSVSLRILFRLLFQAYAEDRGLLPAGRSAIYDEFSLKVLAKRENPDANSKYIWEHLTRVWNAIESGDQEFGVPAYNGGLFNTEQARSPEGFLISTISIYDAELLPVLKKLVVDKNEDDFEGAVDFRSLSVREFGTIYEGLLESSLSVAKEDLTVDLKGLWIPAKNTDQIFAKKDEIYLHTSSGERKSTGSYYTKPQLVDWLITRSLEPALKEHLRKVQQLIDSDEIAKAGKLFFDFRVADIAMGSGHFLVSAIDRIESLMRSFLADQTVSIPRVIDELNNLEATAKSALGEDYASFDAVDSSSLLRRQIARRCIYGLDINPLAVELSRLAIWIHTFVPGLPMSSLDHNLVSGNSLTGIGSLREAQKTLQPGINLDETFYEVSEIEQLLLDAGKQYEKVADNSESTKELVAENQAILVEAKKALEPVKDAFDAALAIRLKLTKDDSNRHADTIEDVKRILAEPGVREKVNSLDPAHFPHLFPEVFARSNPGFDVLLGNPPWEKMVVKPLEWWVKYVPGIKSDSYPKPERDRWLAEFKSHNPELVQQYERDVRFVAFVRGSILAAPFKGLGSADLDLYAAFSWRNWQLLRNAGKIGIVLPRNATLGSGLSDWRFEVLKEGTFSDVAFANNSKQWAFTIHPQTAFALLVIEKSDKDELSFGGPFNSSEEFSKYEDKKISISKETFQMLSESASFRLLDSKAASDVMTRMLSSKTMEHMLPGFSYTTYSDLHATGDLKKKNFTLKPQTSSEELPVVKGSFINLWQVDTDKPYGSCESERITKFFLNRMTKPNRNSPFYNFSNRSVPPFDSARIVFRTTTNATNQRTSIASLIPPKVVTVNMLNVVLRIDGTSKSDAFLLGVVSSRIYDWFLRRIIDRTFTAEIFKRMPIPSQALGTAIGNRITEISARLAAVDDRYVTFAAECGIEVGSVNTEAEKLELIQELDALVAIAYGLARDDVKVIMETFHPTFDHAPYLAKVLEYFEKWSSIE